MLVMVGRSSRTHLHEGKLLLLAHGPDPAPHFHLLLLLLLLACLAAAGLHPLHIENQGNGHIKLC